MITGLLYQTIGIAGTLNERFEGSVSVTFDPTNFMPSWHLAVKAGVTMTAALPYRIVTTVAASLVSATPATSYNEMIGICDTAAAIGEFTTVTVAGWYANAVSTGAITAGANVEVITNGVAVIDDTSTTAKTTNSFAKAMTTASANVLDLWLYGHIVDISGS